jgi:hypothetical protein
MVKQKIVNSLSAKQSEVHIPDTDQSYHSQVLWETLLSKQAANMKQQLLAIL